MTETNEYFNDLEDSLIKYASLKTRTIDEKIEQLKLEIKAIQNLTHKDLLRRNEENGKVHNRSCNELSYNLETSYAKIVEQYTNEANLANEEYSIYRSK